MAEPTYEDVMAALRAADAAGNKEDAARLASIASRLSSQKQPESLTTGGKSDPSRFNPNQGEAGYQANRFMSGVAGLLSLPAEAVYYAGKLQKNTLGRIPYWGEIYPDPDKIMMQPSKAMRQILTDTTMKPPSREAEIRGGVSEFAGGGIIPGGVVVSKAAQKAPAIIGEIGSTVLGGVGSEVAGLPGAIIGSIAGFQTPALVSKAQAVISGVVPWLRNKAQTAAPAELNAAIQANPKSSENIERAQDVSKRIGELSGTEFRPTLGQVTGAPGIIAREEQVARSSPEQLSKYAATREANEAAIAKATDTAFPGGGNIQRAAQSRQMRVTSELEGRLNSINNTRQQLVERFSTKPQQEIGQRLDELKDQAQVAAKGIRDAKIKDVYATADRLGIKESMDDVLQTVRKIGGSDENIFQNMPPIYGKIVNQYGAKTKELTGRSIPPDLMAESAAQAAAKPATFQELHSLWKETNTQYATALRSGDAQSQYYLQQVRDALRSKLDKFEAGGYAELTDKFKDFNRFYATQYAPAFKEGVGGRMAATGRYGEVMKPEDVVSKFFTPSGIDDFNLIYGSNKEAQRVLSDGITNIFRRDVVRNGKIEPRLAQTFLRDNAEALNKIPDIKALLQNPVTANEALIEAAGRTRQSLSEFNKSALARIAKTDNPDALIDKAFNNPKEMRQLVALASGNEQTRDAVLRSIADRVPIAAAKEKTDVLSYVMKHEDTLRPAMDRLGKEHFDNLKTIAAARTILSRTETPSVVDAGKMKDFIEQVTGSSPRTIWAQSSNTTAGRQSGTSAALHLLSRYGIRAREAQAERMLSEAIYNPEIASTWAKMAQGKALSIPESNKFINHFASAGIRILSEDKDK